MSLNRLKMPFCIGGHDMSVALISLIMSWCAGAKNMGPVVVNQPTPEVVCRQKLIKCVEEDGHSTEVPASCLKDSLKW